MKVDIDDFGNERQSRRREETKLFTVPFLPLLFSPSAAFFSAAPFYYHLIIFSLIYSCSLSHHFQHLPISTQSSRASKGERGNMGISFQLFWCHCCQARVQPLWACLVGAAVPQRPEPGGHTLVKGQCSLGGTMESSVRHCSGAGPSACGPVNSAVQPVLCGVILALPPSVFAPLGNPSHGPGLHCAWCHPNTKRTALASAGAVPKPHQNTF